MFSLEGRVALVTGASRGLGFAMAKALAENGAKVIVNARNGEELAAAAAKIGAEAMAFDVTDAKVARAALEDIAARHGKLDVLVNNAGIQHRRPITEWEDADFDRVISVNLASCFRLSRDAVRLMLPNKFGRIINTGSIAGILARLVALGFDRFNVALGETQVLVFEAPIDAAAMLAYLEALPQSANSGDVYAFAGRRGETP